MPMPPRDRSRTCIRCGKVFDSPAGQARYCSQDCRTAAWRERMRPGLPRLRPVSRMPDRTCAECGKVFTPNGSRSLVCSSDCRRARLRKREQAEKAGTYQPQPVQPTCRTVAVREDQPPTKACLQCGALFAPTRSTQVVCSLVCRRERAKGERRPVPRQCPVCGQVYTPKTNARACSATCLEAWHRKRQKANRERRKRLKPTS